ncbi:cell division protein ZapA [Neorickettsia sennetsu]|nr:cell division protein ZapA [Neorickettsia sennetsu]
MLITKKITINGAEYKVACSKEDENRIDYVAEQLNQRVKKISAASHSKLNDATLLLFAALELESLLLDTTTEDMACTGSTKHQQEKVIEYATATIENFIKHVENMD